MNLGELLKMNCGAREKGDLFSLKLYLEKLFKRPGPKIFQCDFYLIAPFLTCSKEIFFFILKGEVYYLIFYFF